MYKRILVLHRFLPIDLKALGDQYVKDEFRRHKTASPEAVKSFMAEWEVNAAQQPNRIQKCLNLRFSLNIEEGRPVCGHPVHSKSKSSSVI